MEMSKKLVAEAFGTFWLVFGGCGAAVLAANFRAASRTSRSLSASASSGRCRSRTVPL